MSKLEDKVLDGLNAVGYNGSLLRNPVLLLQALEGGQKSIEYTTLISFLTDEIRTLLSIDERVNAISSPEDHVSFVMEITSFLKELNCPYKTLTHGLVSDRLQTVSDRLLLLDYLITELMGARILQEKRPSKKIELKLQETPEGKDMRLILQTLRFPKPPANISVGTLFQKLCPTIPIVVNKAGQDIVGQGIFNGYLSEKQWEILNGVQEDLSKEYKIRREMLLTRLDVTIQSFQWSERTKGKDDLFEKIYHDNRVKLKVEPDVDLSDLLAARTELAIIEKTSSSSVRKNTKSKINKVIIGMVPDRGGRTSEIAPPPPEMPSWQQRSSGPQGGGGFGGRGGRNFGRGGGNGFQASDSGSSYQGRGGGANNYQGRGGGNSYQRGGSNNSYNSSYQSNQGGGYNTNKNFDSAGSYSSSNRGYGGNDNRSYDSGRGSSSGYGGRDNDTSYDPSRRGSGGSYNFQESQQNKRAKTYDNFQANKTTYSDQYVQESQNNQQYYSKGNWGSGGRGNDRGTWRSERSNYQRGGYK